MIGKKFQLAVGMLVFVFSFVANADTPKENVKTNVDIPAFTVIGIDTASANGKDKMEKTVALWKKWADEGILSKIPGKIDKDTLAVMHIYEASATGSWSMMIGARVDSKAQPPPGMVKVQVPASKYAQLSSRKGPAGEVTPEAWKTIWQMKELQRKYAFDYEVHAPGDQKSTVVQLFVSTH